MSNSINIFIGYNSSLVKLIGEVGPILGMEFTLVPAMDSRYTDYYESVSDAVAVEVFDADGFVNDRELRFEDYQYFLRVTAYGYADWQEEAKTRETFAREVFDKLKATGRYPLLMVFNMETLLDQFDPIKLTT